MPHRGDWRVLNRISSFQAFQHGEVYPAGCWKPSKRSMKPNAEGVSEYVMAQEMEKEHSHIVVKERLCNLQGRQLF